MASSRSILVGVLVVACAAPRPGEPGARTNGAPVVAAPASAPVTPGSPAPREGTEPPGTKPAEQPAPASTASAFPPADFEAPSPKSALKGDGHWTAFGDKARSERAAEDPPLIVRTLVHPHPSSRFVTVTIAAVDLSRVALRLVPGTEDLAWAKLPVTPQSGLVPADDQDSLLFIMNGGFQPRHGKWGLVANGVVVSEPHEPGCTMGLHEDGTLRVAPWPRLEPERSKLTSIRQTPPCLVDQGAVHPLLVKGQDKAWGGHAADVNTQRRSAAGVDKTGRILFYALGEEAEPRHLAEALRVAGASAAVELDINWYWTRFLLFGTASGALRVSSPLVAKMEGQAHGYVVRASTRDFFYGVRRKEPAK
jgi:hypothetical protein